MSEEYKQLQKEFQEHEKDFAGFKAVSEERYKNLSEKLDTLIKNSESEDATIQSILVDHNDRIINNHSEIEKVKTERSTERRMNKTWILIGTGIAVVLAPISAIIFEKLFLGG